MTTASRLSSWAARIVIAPIRLYQRFVSPMRPATCRFYPTCSSYAVQALQTHGVVVGAWLASRRLLRCHPWTAGGVDHVPPAGQWRHVHPPYDPRESNDASAPSSLNPPVETHGPDSVMPRQTSVPARRQGA